MAEPGSIPPDGPELADALRLAARRLGAAGIESPERDARLLLAAASGLAELSLITEPSRRLDGDARARFDAMLIRRLGREPVSRILGVRGFYGRDFEVGPATLDPRPDTETLIEAALAIVDEEGWRSRPIRILDVGTGTGVLLVTLLAELPLASGLGTEISEAALAVARRNGMRNGVSERAQWRVTRSLDSLDGPFDLLVSNPPYIPSPEIAGLEPEVRCFDPGLALDGGADGLATYREILPRLSDVVPRGWAIFEVGSGQAPGVATLVRLHAASGRPRIRTFMDLGGHERCVAARTQC